MAEITAVSYEIFCASLQSFGIAEDRIKKFFSPPGVTFSIDSRNIQPHSVFIALEGEIHDGHDFVAAALAKGALLAVVKKNHPKLISVAKESLIEVDDPLAVLSELSRRHIASMPAIKIALTGSNGKTTIKEMIKAALSAVVGAEHVYASPGNKNNHIGLPLSSFALTKQHQYAIFEMGMNHSQEIAHLCSIVKPDFGIITMIGPAHEGNFSDGILGVQRAKAELFDAISPHGHAIVNSDDARINHEASQRKFKNVSSFGWSKGAHIQILETGLFDEEKHRQLIKIKLEDQTIDVLIPLPGRHHAMNAAGALAVVHALGLSVEKAALGIGHMAITPGRTNLIKHAKGFTIIDDGYNANPSSMIAGVMATQSISAKRAIAVIGAMGELGVFSKQHHQQLGQLLAIHFERLFICGEEAKACVEAALASGYPKDNIVFKTRAEELIAPLMASLEKDDLIFIKGSLSNNMNCIVKALVEMN